jgi:hypothetical protein
VICLKPIWLRRGESVAVVWSEALAAEDDCPEIFDDRITRSPKSDSESYQTHSGLREGSAAPALARAGRVQDDGYKGEPRCRFW